VSAPRARPGAPGRVTFLSGIAALLLAGCVTTRATMLAPGPHPPVDEADVRVYADRSGLPEGCEPLVAIRTRGDVDLTTPNQMIAAARRRAASVGVHAPPPPPAAAVGANALVVERIREPGTGEQIAAVLFGTPDPRTGRMVGYRCPATTAEPDGGETPAAGPEVTITVVPRPEPAGGESLHARLREGEQPRG
jgi:hypothetical protein